MTINQKLPRDIPLCVNCLYHRENRTMLQGQLVELHQCSAMTGAVAPIDGGQMGWMDCGFMRLSPCGYEGHLFEPKGSGSTN